ncbi:hypothetical protein RGF97_00670 [Streptomyces roseicoloratus]|uniref:Integral membrane protein n=1 Tax=Streptomyces roseicoloratus TaxID=2508722 RepID=A0ABY9RP56_9ACTN|nr:hypothetical protein [Streptomyces roseicoloratus]WMX43682.1 hypothetical protein RGF97_00670 [Streptomyces roseicoloratus]
MRDVMAAPGRLPESLAVFAQRRFGPKADRAVRRLRASRPDADADELRTRVVAHGVRRASAEGAFVGGPFILLVPFAFCAALLSQAQSMLELAALEGKDPTDPERTAELLVLQGVYEDTDTARVALAEPAAQSAEEGGTGKRRGRFAALWELIMRMARLLGLITPTTETRLLTRIGLWALVGAVFLVGLVAPLVWLPYLAFSYRRSTLALLDRAAVFYAGAPAPRRGNRFDPAMIGATVRAAFSLLVSLAGVAVVVGADLHIAGGRWPVLGIVLVSSSFLVGGWWVWRRHRRRND